MRDVTVRIWTNHISRWTGKTLATVDKRASPLSTEEDLEGLGFAVLWVTHYEDTDYPAQGSKYSTLRLVVLQPYT